MRKITARQAEVLITISNFIEKNGIPPTYRELMKELNLSSTASVKSLLDRLKQKNYITWQEGLPRTLKITERAYQI
ncbi:transcriptional regulator [Bacillus inaquosorum]|uniref:LexA family protein n=1 Tax=Bacillus inaquosorum TaxID=483913 RepID=UPI0022820017|nr:transcriptional regulator [Bacillus inaquosorum]MCY8284871.1 transcriptional regulator [Bacillus inaquosorum]MCY9380412.1 transcriptional regulator [Bacillus inaquosorum]